MICGLEETAGRILGFLVTDGVALGEWRVVPLSILLGVLWFFGLFLFTRWLKTKLEDDWLKRARVEASVRESVATLFGYTTLVIAAIVGLSIGGMEFSTLALIIGALSVGIGLQNVVSNFVSGLVLLFERPIRRGDYIAVGDTEGYVRRIRLRHTEIET